MALTVALPLSGLNPDNFSTLNAKLFKLANERNLPTAGRESPSTASDSSGVSSCMTYNTSSVEITPNSSRPITPIRLIDQKKSEEKINNINIQDKKGNQEKEQKMENIRILYENRDILNLGGNIRPATLWQPLPTARANVAQSFILRQRNNKEEKNVKETPLCIYADCKFSTNKMLTC
ncbi:uncharacterized protein [Linepithema humile]|uniref:uncharacterized protein n=1 Tax=Linepithema humile TaxID=83485 RepID=UPI0006237645|nr:PREDICTED: uncharacterized protein LOC105670967 [Linepithema humile]